MYRALVRDDQQLLAIHFREFVTINTDHSFELIDHAHAMGKLFVVGTLEAIVGVHFSVAHLDCHTIKREILAIGIHAQRHRRARTERGSQEFIR